MLFQSKRARALSDAKRYGAIIAQLKKPFAIVMNDVMVTSDEVGAHLITHVQEGHPQGEPIIWFDPAGYDRYFYASRHDVSHRSFQGMLWLFDNVSEDYKTIEDLESRLRHIEADQRMINEVRQNINIPVWITGENNQLHYHNIAYETQFGTAVPAALRDIVKEKMRSQEASITIIPAIVQGARRQLEVHTQPMKNGRILVWSIDRSDEMDALSSRDRILSAQRALFEQLHTAVAMFDQQAKLTFYNSAYANLWDLDDAYLNGKPTLSDIFDKLRATRRLPEQADFKSYKEYWLRLFTTLMSPQEDMLYLPDGRTLRLLTVPNPAGGLFMTFEDVSTTLELESSLNTLLAVQRETLDHMTEAMAVYGSDGRLKLWNQQYARMWNLYPEELADTPHVSSLLDKKIKVFSPDARPTMKQKLLSMALERKEIKGWFETEDERHINYMSVPLPDGATLLAYDDVTDAHQVQKALRDKAEALEAAERLKLDFLANVSYQLRTPLNAIIGFAELLDNQYFGTLNQKQSDYAKGITEAGQRLLSLVDDILDLSTIEAGYLQINQDTINLEDMLASVYRLTEEWARKSQHNYTLKVAKDIGQIDGDERRLKQVLINLIRNAIAFTPRGGVIEIGASRDKDALRIWVKDNGLGIATEDQDRVFKAFERIDESDTTQRAGAGLGLTLVQSIISLHNGHIDLDSAPGKGTTITLVFPAA